MSLGKVDYGLYGVVGGLTVFISFFNGVLATAIGRFYAYSVGRARTATSFEEGIECCRAWFNTAILIHSTIPVLLMIVGYPVGIWAVRHFLVIPPDRVEVCVWVFRFVCITCFVSMVNVPFQAMYTAKQYIAELTIYGFAQSAINVCFLYYMVSHPGDWLLKYAAWACFVAITPQIIICARAFCVFPECRIRLRLLWSRSRMFELGSFAFWQVFGLLGHLLKGQGVALVVNKYFGPSVNAAMSVANQVNGQTAALSSSLQGAFTPAITEMYGARNFDLMRKMSYRACKFGTLLVLVFLVPLSLELPEVIRLWLKNPPEFTVGLCLCMMINLILDKSTLGQKIAIYATGQIARYQVVSGGALMLTFPLAWLFSARGLGVYSVGFAMVLTMLVCVLGRVWYARGSAGLRARTWVISAIAPLTVVMVFAYGIGCVPHFFMEESFVRVCITTMCSEVAFVLTTWFIALSSEERSFVSGKIKTIVVGKLRGFGL